MTYKYQILLGKISRINGYDGSVIVKLEYPFLDNIPDMESVFLEINGKPVPFFISSCEYSGGDQIRLQFDGNRDYDILREFIGCRVFLTTVNEGIQPAEKPEDLTGFRVIQKHNILIGTIKETVHNPGQDLLRIISPDNREILMPFHEDFIVRFDMKKKNILVKLPEGLTEIN